MVKRIFGMIIGNVFIALGIVFFRVGKLGNDGYASLCFSISELTNLQYGIINILINAVLFIFLYIFLKNKINIGTFVNMFLIGFIVDIFLNIFSNLNINDNSLLIKIVFGSIGIILESFGLALYVQADFGIAPYDGVVIIVNKYGKIKFQYSRMLCDMTAIIMAFIISNIILDGYAVGIFTVLTFVFIGPLMVLFGKFVNKYLYNSSASNI